MEPVRSPYGPPSAFLQWKAVERPSKGRRVAEGAPRRWRRAGMVKKENPAPVVVAGMVICTRFELVTSCLSSKRSKPTELTDQFQGWISLAKSGAKVHTFFKLAK